MDEVIAAARRRSAALVGKDVRAMEALLHPAFVYGNAAGERLNRGEYLDRYVASPAMRWARQDLEDVEIRRLGDLAILSCRTHDVAEFGGEPFDGWFRSLHVWAREDAAWRCLAIQTTAISPGS